MGIIFKGYVMAKKSKTAKMPAKKAPKGKAKKAK